MYLRLRIEILFLVLLSGLPVNSLADDGGIIKNQSSPHAEISSTDLNSVRWTEGFWADRFDRCRRVTLPRLWELAEAWAWHNMRVAAGEKQGEARGCNWQDAWLYKWVESASYIYSQTRDAALLDQMDRIIEMISRAQQPDGYLATQITLRSRERFSNYSHHEAYTMGHLLTAASLHSRITGKPNFLEVAKRVGDFLYREYTSSENPYLINCPVNPSGIMGGVELYRTTGTRKYLDLAEILINNRGKKRAPVPMSPWGRKMGNTDLNQDRIPLREAREVVGHAVFWSYLFSGAADAFMETGDPTLLQALERLWSDLVGSKMYITGGVSPLHKGLSSRSNRPGERIITNDGVHEAAGLPYDLPTATAYNETCGQIGNLMWNWRMLAITGGARYADVMEQSLYNAILSGVNVSGKGWSYTNPLRWHGAEHELLSNDVHVRSDPGEHKICCPTNLMRTEASWNGCLYGSSEDSVWVHHYGGSRATLEMSGGGRLILIQETEYPWDGVIRLRFDQVRAQKPIKLRLRIPGWASGASLKVNGEETDSALTPSSYAEVSRSWSAGDIVELNLPMRVRLMVADPRVEQTRNQVAVQRGPVVYCLESIDLPEAVRFEDVHLRRDAKWSIRYEQEVLGGVVVLETEGVLRQGHDGSFGLYQQMPRTEPVSVPVRLIPYFAWNNRGEPRMSVWLPLAG